MSDAKKIDELERKLEYQFSNKNLLKLALTHRSYADENNERLEFLGDSIVNCVIAAALFKQFVYAQEGHLSRWRAGLVNRDTLADLGRRFELGRYLYLGPGELKSGGSDRHSIVSCAMEAIIGAIYLDANFEVAQNCILKWYQELLAAISYKTHQKDPKTQLQEYLQRKQRALPVYQVETVEGEMHQQTFTVSCELKELGHKTIGKGVSRRRAEQEAASIMLGILKI